MRTSLSLLALLVSLCLSAFARSSSVSTGNTFLIASDFHFNPMADASLVPRLEAADPNQWEAIFKSSKSTAYSQYGQDTNWWLLQSSLDQMRKTLPHPAFILVTGDSLAHRFPQTYQSITHDNDRERYRKFVLNTVKFLALQFRRRFPDTKIFLTPGNNDEECGNYSVEAGGCFFHDTADLVRDLAQGDDQLRASWEALGSYDAPHPTIHGVRIISLNTVFFSDKYHAEKISAGCSQISSEGPEQAFLWLESRLSQAKQAGEKVWLMFHIPPGIDSYSTVAKYQTLSKGKSLDPASESTCLSSIVPMWVPSWTAQFDDLLAKYQGTVIATFAGHTHNDDFRLINRKGDSGSFILINPAVSPIYNQNPAFRTLSFAKDGSLLGSSVYYLTNLIFASSTTPGEWQREYTFSQEWHMARMDSASLSTLYDKITSDEVTRNDWLKLFNVSSPAAYLPVGSAPGLYCAIENMDPEGYGRCYCPALSGH